MEMIKGNGYDLLANINVFPSSYWVNTSANSIVRNLIEKPDTLH